MPLLEEPDAAELRPTVLAVAWDFVINDDAPLPMGFIEVLFLDGHFTANVCEQLVTAAGDFGLQAREAFEAFASGTRVPGDSFSPAKRFRQNLKQLSVRLSLL
jgi:hypothetical protein